MTDRSETTVEAILRAEDPEIPWTGPGGLFQKAADKIEQLQSALRDVSDLIDGYADADHNGNSFVPNNAMRAQQLIAEALGVLKDE